MNIVYFILLICIGYEHSLDAVIVI